MAISEIKVKNQSTNYSIFVGSNIIKILPKKISIVCPGAKKIGLVIDKKIPKKFKNQLKKSLKKYEIHIFEYAVNEKLKSFYQVNRLAEKCLSLNFNRNDILIAFGGGIIGDFCGFTSSIIKRGVNFINLPSTLLSQVDSSLGGKTAVNSNLGKNLIGTFYQPKLVISDTDLLKSLPYREIVCGYAEILKHALISSSLFFKWLKTYSKEILNRSNQEVLKLAIIKSCKVKQFFIQNDVYEKNIRMILNFGHTFAHAIEVQNKYSSKINHGEAVIMGMMLAVKLSYIKKACKKNLVNEISEIYEKNRLNYKIEKFFKKNEYNQIIDNMSNDKKNNDKKINFIFLKKIGKTTKPNKNKISVKELKKIFPRIISI